MLNEDVIYIKVPELNVSKTHDLIRDMFYDDVKLYQQLGHLVNSTNRDIQVRSAYMKKKWFHLRTSNLGEKEYRLEEKALQVAELKDMTEIKENLLTRLYNLNLPGFQAQDDLLESILSKESKVRDPTKKYKVEERSYLSYKKNQLLLLEKLLLADYTSGNGRQRHSDSGMDNEYMTEAQAETRRNTF